MATPRVTKDLTTGIGTLSFPKVFPSTKGQKDDGTDDYNLQFIIPKMVDGKKNPDVRAIMAAIKEVGEAKWGDNYRKVRIPLRDGDKEADDITDDGSTKGEKYPERKGCYFFNARSNKPVGIVDRKRVPITNSDDLYGGCKVKINVTFFPYAQSGNSGIGIALNGVQKVADGESFGGGRPSVESMFDLLEGEEDTDLEDDDFLEEDEAEEVEPEPVKKAPARKAAAKKAAAPAKKAAAKKPAPEPVEEDEDADLLDIGDEDGEGWDDLDDEDEDA